MGLIIFLWIGFLLSMVVGREALCSDKGFSMKARVEVVQSNPDLRVQIVQSNPDWRIKIVENDPFECGEWRIVTSLPDIRIQYVTSNPDIRVKFVSANPGKE